MSWWQAGATANAIVSVAYFLIVAAILVPLLRTRQVLANRLGLATAAIFFTCGVHHGTHAVHLIGPTFGYDVAAGEALRRAFTFHTVVWDSFSAVVGVYYWSLRRTYGSLMRGAALFEDLKEKQRQALQINDDIVQGLVVAKMALELDDRERSQEAMAHALASASGIISDLLGNQDPGAGLGAGALVRERPAEPTPDVAPA